MPDLKSHEVLDSILRDINNRSVQEFHQGEKAACFEPKLSDNDEVLEAGEQFSLDNYQVVRREFFAHLSEPAVTFYNCKFYVNAACLHRFPGVDYVQALVNQEKKVLVLLPCEEGARDAVPWSIRGRGKPKPKQVTCKLFTYKLFTLMEWAPQHRYKIMGKIIHARDTYLIAFDLTAPEVYEKTVTDDSKTRVSRVPVFPAEWKDQFGLPYYEHKLTMQVNIFDGYAVYAIKDNGLAEQQIPDTSLATATQGGITDE